MDMEIIKTNWNTYKTILGRLGDENIDNMLESVGERLCLAPANNNNKQYGCYAGGIVGTSTKLAKAMQALNEFHGNPVDIKSVYKVGLLHDVGRLGTLTEDWLLPQDSDWHREKLGNMFKYNVELPMMTHLHRTMLLLNQFQIKLTEEEFYGLASLEDRIAKNKLGALLLHARDMLEE